MNSQVSLTDQLARLVHIADQHGLYDAADFLRNHVEQVNARCARRTIVPVSADYVSDVFGDAPISAIDKDGLNVTAFYLDAEDDLCATISYCYPCVWDKVTKQWVPF